MQVVRSSKRDLHEAVLGSGAPRDVRGWLDRHIGGHLQAAIESVTFEAGDIDAVFGLRLADGRDVVLKALRGRTGAERARTVAACQSLLAQRGFGCPTVIEGPSVSDGVTAIVEERIWCSPAGHPHQPEARSEMAAALARQVELLRGVDGSALVRGRPAWADWSVGAWPPPHDPVFDFTTPAAGFEWIDDLADAAAAELRGCSRPPVIGHSDWVWQNVCVRDGRFVAGYDWNSLIFAPEGAVVGLNAGAFTQGSPRPPDAPPWAAVLAFIEAYESARGIRFTAAEGQTVRAAARWVRAYNARCQIDNQLRRGMPPPSGSFLAQLGAERGTG